MSMTRNDLIDQIESFELELRELQLPNATVAFTHTTLTGTGEQVQEEYILMLYSGYLALRGRCSVMWRSVVMVEETSLLQSALKALPHLIRELRRVQDSEEQLLTECVTVLEESRESLIDVFGEDRG